MSDIEKYESPKHVDESAEDLFSQRSHQQFADVADNEARVAQLAQEMGINTRKLMWKIDLWVVPPFCLLYFLSFLDRVNISNAKLYGIVDDLHLKGNEYNTALTLFFVPYIVFEILLNYVIKKIRPRYWLAGLIFIFGVISIGMGFVTNFGGLAACRFLLGMSEALTFPAIFYVLLTYYSKYEAQQRFSAFFSVTTLAGAASGSIAWRIKDLDGRYGIAAWQWIFIIEGTFTAGLAFVLLFLIPDFPEELRFLNANEVEFLKRKLEIINGSLSAHEIQFKIKDVLNVLKDYMIWLPTLGYFACIIPAYAIAFFLAQIVKDLGYTAVAAQAHSVYPWLCAFGLCNIVAFLSDRTRWRYPFFLATGCIAIAGLGMVLGLTDANVRYAGTFLTCMGLYTAMPTLICWQTLSFGSHIRKSVGLACIIGFGNIGGIISTFLFLQKDAPQFTTGLAVCIAMMALSLIVGTAILISFWWQNKRKQTPEYQNYFYSLPEREQKMLGDRAPTFKYMY